MKIIKSLRVIILILPSMLFAQTTYNGPASGSVTSGVIVTTDNFSANAMGDEIFGQPRIMELLESDEEPLISKK